MSDIIYFLFYPFISLISPDSQYYWVTYLTAAVIGVAAMMMIKRRWLGLTAIRHILWPDRIVKHASTRLDIKFFIFGSYFLLCLALLIGGFTFVGVEAAVAALDWFFGFRPEPSEPSWMITGMSMFLLFLTAEFGYWLSHFLMHRIPALWEFHKVHHSAEVLSPVTEWRQHPVELAFFPVLIGVVSVPVHGPITWAFGYEAQAIDPVPANLIFMVFWYTTVHLRHTDLPIFVPDWLAKLIHTPPHHQVHHSTDPKHFDKNMGYCLSLFDWLFGTLYIPKKDEKLTYGLGHQDSALETAVGSVVAPFGRVAAIAAKPLRKRWQKEASEAAPAAE